MGAMNVQMYCGTGMGRSAAAIGQGIRFACSGKTVFVVEFLKGKASMEYDYLRKLEPEIKVFCFDRFDVSYSHLNEEERREERIHTINGLNYARKVAATSECDVLILDEALDLVSLGIVDVKELISLIEGAGDDVSLILTGTDRCEKLWPYVDRVYPFRRESASKLIRFMAENAPAGFDHSGRNVPD